LAVERVDSPEAGGWVGLVVWESFVDRLCSEEDWRLPESITARGTAAAGLPGAVATGVIGTTVTGRARVAMRASVVRDRLGPSSDLVGEGGEVGASCFATARWSGRVDGGIHVASDFELSTSKPREFAISPCCDRSLRAGADGGSFVPATSRWRRSN
jgi:hypothetical protein